MRGGALDASVTLEEVLIEVAAKRVPLAPELAGYLVLELAEHADAKGGDVDPKSVFVSDEGAVALVRSRRDRVVGDAETSLRAALGRLLEAGGSQTPALSATSKRRNGAGMTALAAELQAALIPVNRDAARRALARLAREVKRITLGVDRNALASSPARGNLREPISFVAEATATTRSTAPRFSAEEDPTTARSKIPKELLPSATMVQSNAPGSGPPERPPSSPSPEADVDALIAQFRVSGGSEQQHARALKAIAELEPTPAPPRGVDPLGAGRTMAPAEKAQVSNESDIEALLAMNSDSPATPVPAAPVKARHTPAPSRGAAFGAPSSKPPAASAERQLPTQPAQLRKVRTTLPSTPTASNGRGTGWLMVLGVMAIAGGSYAVWQFRANLLPRHAPASAGSAVPAPVGAPPVCFGMLVITDVPSRAEVLLHEGQAPVDIPRMPVGARLEFVATAEGYAPKRVVVPGGVPWDSGPDGKPRFEAAVQLDPTRAPAGGNDPWPVGEPGSAVGGEGSPGTVRVVASPRGAEVWMLAGIAPEARIDHLRCDQDIDVLLAGPTTYRNRLRVHSSDFVADESPGASLSHAAAKARVARVSGR